MKFGFARFLTYMGFEVKMLLTSLSTNEKERTTFHPIILLILQINRGYVTSVCFILYITFKANTLDPAAFGALVKEMTIKREEHILDKSNLIIKMDPRIARIFHNSHNVSSKSQRLSFMLAEKGKSHKLLRKALLRDRKIIKEEENKELDRAVKSIPGLVDEINQLLFEIQEKNDKIQAYDKDQEILIKLFDMGVINGDGDLINQEKCENMD